jgi:hypothetical protein
MRNKAKLNEKDVKKLYAGEPKRNKVRLRQFRFHEPLKTILNQNETCGK